MSKTVLKLYAALLSTAALLTLVSFHAYADIAPEPIVERVGYGPFALIAAVVVAALVLLKKLFGKK